MAYTQQELNSISASILQDFDKKGWKLQDGQQMPMLANFKKKAGKFAGGKGKVISVGLKHKTGAAGFQGYDHDDTVTFNNPAQNMQAEFTWKEHHDGLSMTHTELKEAGYNVVDKKITKTSQSDKLRLGEYLESKIEDWKHDFEDGMNSAIFSDGVTDTKVIAGIRSIILDDPTTDVSIAGINQNTYKWWQNRVNLTVEALALDINTTPLHKFLQKEVRQLRRFAKDGTDLVIYAGSEVITQYEEELIAKGTYNTAGYKGKALDLAIADALTFGSIPVVYDPTLDDATMADRFYIVDHKAIQLRNLDGKFLENHEPARPHDKYATYRSMTNTSALVATRRNSSGVYKLKPKV
ncbi:MAG: phage major capsid protein [Proteobacteria bacterium]|nr:phage major capsid protein [Pseudomonadota bacterium]